MSRSVALAFLLLVAPLVASADACDCRQLKPLSDAVRTESPVIVFGSRDATGRLTTRICTRTTPAEHADDVRRGLGPATTDAVAEGQTPVTPASFKTTKAKVTVDRTVLSLSSAVATVEPRPNAPGYRWLRVHLYAFPLTPADVADAVNGHVDSLEHRWNNMAGRTTAQYNVSNAVLQFGIDKDGKVWQLDLSMPGHGCTIAASDREAKAVLQDYQFDGTHLRLKSAGSHTCDLKSMGVPDQRYGWDVDLAVPVFATGMK